MEFTCVTTEQYANIVRSIQILTVSSRLAGLLSLSKTSRYPKNKSHSTSGLHLRFDGRLDRCKALVVNCKQSESGSLTFATILCVTKQHLRVGHVKHGVGNISCNSLARFNTFCSDSSIYHIHLPCLASSPQPACSSKHVAQACPRLHCPSPWQLDSRCR